MRVVFDGTSSGINEALWAPNFFLPSSRAASVLLTFSTWLADVDFGEMFHNFFVANRIRKYSGVDVYTPGRIASNPSDAGQERIMCRTLDAPVYGHAV